MAQQTSDSVILFGAGASLGSEPDGSPRPPLAADLYGELAKFAPRTWGALPGNYPARFRTDDFESTFAKLGSDSPSPLTPGFSVTGRYPADLAVPLVRGMAKYFASFSPSARSRYIELARRINVSGWNGAVVSLNYDLLLPLSFRHCGITIDPTHPHLAVPRFCLPHGSCALFPVGSPFRFPEGTVFRGLDNQMTGGRIVWEPEVATVVTRLEQQVPVIAYFEPQKRAFVGADFLQDQRHVLQDAVLSASTVVIVGARVRPRDAHIWNPLAVTPAKLVYVSPDAQGFEDWCGRVGRSGDVTASRKRFDEAIDEICYYAKIG